MAARRVAATRRRHRTTLAAPLPARTGVSILTMVSAISRRALLGGVLGGSAYAALAGSPFARAQDAGLAAARPRRLIVRSTRPENLETPTDLLDADFTPNDVFFVRSHFGPPIVDPRTFRLDVSGLCDRPLSLSLDELRKFPEVTVPAVLQCSGNGRALFRPRIAGAQWERGAVGQARWTGVRLADVLRHVGANPGARFVRLLGADRAPMPTVPEFARSVPLDKAMHPMTILAYGMNGEPLPILHGAPLRLVVPAWAGDHWVKWLRSIRLDAAEDAGFYMKTAYRMPRTPVVPGGSVKPEDTDPLTGMIVKALITSPADSQVLGSERVAVTGVAFAGEDDVKRVDVSVDGGKSYLAATLDPPRGLGAWQRWRFLWRPKPGTYRLLARATDTKGRTQPDVPTWNPSGYLWNAPDAITCEVRA